MWGIVKACRRPTGSHCRFTRATGGGFPRLSGRVARGLRCAASLRHALLAENLGKPPLWVIISVPWYQPLSGAPAATRRTGSVAAGSRRWVSVRMSRTIGAATLDPPPPCSTTTAQA